MPLKLVVAETEAEFVTKRPQANAAAAKLAYDKTKVSEPPGPTGGVTRKTKRARKAGVS